ncbi:AEC family transporter [Burkholderia dolosa]|uniref:AEC family transporter n=1 Tax=Burkholderia dolosa TaxID=152500 RepID=UPI001C973F38|nr:AEC family transporter [Burkholderia dolosa]MBY4830924.1 AEC family transporter [Burkholderia dolosa]
MHIRAAASPCALVSVGLFVVAKREPAGVVPRGSAALIATKLLVQPALAWWVGVRVLGRITIVPAAPPAGIGSHMLADSYGREAQVTSRAILLSTLGSIVSRSVLLAIAPHA